MQGIPDELPEPKEYDASINHAPRRKGILTKEEKKLALKNALRYFHPRYHATLAGEFYDEFEKFGRIYMYRFRPDYDMYASVAGISLPVAPGRVDHDDDPE